MVENSFTTSLMVDAPPAQVFEVINDVRRWWTGDIEGQADRVGAQFTYRYRKLHRTTQRIAELVPGKRVVWEIVESSLTFVENQQEWDGTRIVFELVPKGRGTELRFTHEGLVPALECFEDCKGAWTHYVSESLPGAVARAAEAVKGPRPSRKVRAS
ncbi:MAG: SRPBCC domain-containing protein [Myxococcaceae bacterium]|nr:SRPBCC domain-containing protein [Myxococcaceae bacterium]